MTETFADFRVKKVGKSFLLCNYMHPFRRNDGALQSRRQCERVVSSNGVSLQ